MSTPYRIPAQATTIESTVAKSRFIATIFNVETVDAVKHELALRRARMSDASHHVYAFRLGFGNSVIEGLSDDGEPTGTSGPPIMNVLRGSELGDALIVVTRYFGGTLLGTGGLVRAYSEAASLAIKACPTIVKVRYAELRLLIEYSALKPLKRALAEDFAATITSEIYTDSVELAIRLPSDNVNALRTYVRDLTSGNVYIETLD